MAVAAPARQPAVVNPFLARKARPLVVGHRGVQTLHQENTLAGFRRAVALGIDAIELDVRITRDGRAVVFHDASAARLTGVRRAIADMTWDEIAALVRGRHRAIVAAEIAAAGVSHRVLVTSFDPRKLHEVRRLAPAIAVGHQWSEWLFGLGPHVLGWASDVDAVGADYALVGEATVRRLRRQGVAVGAHVLFPLDGRGWPTPRSVACSRSASTGSRPTIPSGCSTWSRVAESGVEGKVTGTAPRGRTGAMRSR